MTRKPTYYFVNVFFPMASFVLMGCCHFAIDVTDHQGRLEYLGAIVLTCSACNYHHSPPPPLPLRSRASACVHARRARVDQGHTGDGRSSAPHDRFSRVPASLMLCSRR